MSLHSQFVRCKAGHCRIEQQNDSPGDLQCFVDCEALGLWRTGEGLTSDGTFT